MKKPRVLKTRLWRLLELEADRELALQRAYYYEGDPIHAKVLRKDRSRNKKRISRQSAQEISCGCDGANAIKRVRGAVVVALGTTRYHALMPSGRVEIGEFHGNEVHLRHDSNRSAVGLQFSLSTAIHSPNPNPRPYRKDPVPARGRRYKTKREQVISHAFE